MRNIVGCRIKTVKTGLFCEIAIGWNNGYAPFVWSRIENKMARLDIPKNGQWGYLNLPQYGGTSISIHSQSPTIRTRDGNQAYQAISELLALPQDFMEKAECGNYSKGHGMWRLTNEAVEYELFLPCV